MTRTEKERKYWDRVAKDRSFYMIHDRYPDIEDIVDFFMSKIAKYDQMILELGSGTGRIIGRIESKMPHLWCCGVDTSEEMIALAKELRYGDVEYQHCNGRQFDFKFDLGYSYTVFQHIDDEGVKEYLKRIKKNMSRIGRFVLQFVEGTEKTEFSWQRSKKEMINWIEEAGFKINNIDSDKFIKSWVFIEFSHNEKR